MSKIEHRHTVSSAAARKIVTQSVRSGWRGIHFSEIALGERGSFESCTSQLGVAMAYGPMRLFLPSRKHSYFDHTTDPVLSLPGDHNVGAWEGAVRGVQLFVEPRAVERITDRSFRIDAFQHHRGARLAIRHLLRALHADVVAGHLGGSTLGEEIVSSIIHQLLEENCQVPSTFVKGTQAVVMKRLRDWIEAHLDKTITLDEIATEAGVSVRHLCRTFRVSTGKSPHRFIMERRVERAKLLIYDGALSLQEIADATGFGSQAHMTDTFRKLAGATPMQFRNIG